MLTLITGQPGNGKTLHALYLVEKLRKETGRVVYYWNIKGLQLPWEPMGDPSTFGRWKEGIEPDMSVIERWWELPAGAIIFIDEAQGVFRPRGRSGPVPPIVAHLETHRHSGHDIFMLTQHPQLIDMAVRKLAGRHIDVVRRFGREAATVYQWELVRDPSSDKDRREALKTKWVYPRELYGKYSSAELHTVRRDFPLKLILRLGALAAVCLAAIGYAYVKISGLTGDDQVPATEEGFDQVQLDSTPVFGPRPAFWSGEARTARLEDRPESAPLYDHLQEVRSQPLIAGCYSLVYESGMVMDCRCYTDQRTRAKVSVSQCIEWVRDGEYDPRREQRQVDAAAGSWSGPRSDEGQREE